jgi:Ca-activated chloride channel family protein
MFETAHILIAAGAAGACALAEWLHARRAARVNVLAFSATPRRAWVIAAPALRVIGCGVLMLGLLTVLATDGQSTASADATAKRAADKHVVIAMDVSPSMFLIKDAGPSGKQSRRERARDVLSSTLRRLDLSRTRVSVVAFWDSAKPVVIDTFDMNVVTNVIGDLPLHYAFKGPKTDLSAGVREAARLATPWNAGSTTLIVVSDGGDSVAGSALSSLPAAISDVLVVGVGDPFRSSPVGQSMSRQDRESLNTLAVRTRGQYVDANSRHLPSDTLRSLRMLMTAEQDKLALRTIGLICCGVGGVLIAGVPAALALFGSAQSVRASRGRSRVGWANTGRAMDESGVMAAAGPRAEVVAAR